MQRELLLVDLQHLDQVWAAHQLHLLQHLRLLLEQINGRRECLDLLHFHTLRASELLVERVLPFFGLDDRLYHKPISKQIVLLINYFK